MREAILPVLPKRRTALFGDVDIRGEDMDFILLIYVDEEGSQPFDADLLLSRLGVRLAASRK